MRHYVCHRATSLVEIDGDLTKAVWGSAPWSEEFVDIEGDLKPKPRFKTRVKMLWDDKFFYLGAELEEPQVWATLTERDSIIFFDNDFELFLDPDGDNHNYVELEINAFGTIWDLLMSKPYRDGGMPMTGWLFKNMLSAVKVKGPMNAPDSKSEGWMVEIAIPWSSIKEVCRCACPPKEGDMWRANFSRVEWPVEVVDGRYRKVEGKPEENWCWSPQGVVDLHRPEHWGVIQFTCLEGPQPALPDPSRTPRELLHRLYYAQRDFRNANGRWATSLCELEFESLRPIELHATPNYFEAIYHDGGKDWHIGSDSHFWQGESYESRCVRGETEFRPDFGAPNIDFK